MDGWVVQGSEKSLYEIRSLCFHRNVFAILRKPNLRERGGLNTVLNLRFLVLQRNSKLATDHCQDGFCRFMGISGFKAYTEA